MKRAMAELIILSSLVTFAAAYDDLLPTYRDDEEESARIAVVSVLYLCTISTCIELHWRR